MEKAREDCRESETGVEARLAELALRESLRVAGLVVGDEGRYEDVGDYDAVLRWHCRL